MGETMRGGDDGGSQWRAATETTTEAGREEQGQGRQLRALEAAKGR